MPKVYCCTSPTAVLAALNTKPVFSKMMAGTVMYGTAALVPEAMAASRSPMATTKSSTMVATLAAVAGSPLLPNCWNGALVSHGGSSTKVAVVVQGHRFYISGRRPFPPSVF
ncbi:hypothetical protein B0T26DRAFT_428508 [Lasiosphaeria miniovina]|uniref:Uncharacterized protein n=1 Tax=Lasiosphaeria miniovina TaxID=1954250 RepID=A0AA40DQN4_9PEZI|nr:uncharacterized protein B0T26DRAFT_428508 [Lasiosphaeria miniovina]KAK0709911.1 hypothetical protein B0T26DRAFT_428508 [Lasiosphaeria miniovina]